MSVLRPIDLLGRRLSTLRISVTDRCNLRCQYCMPAELLGREVAFLPRDQILSFEELTRVSAAFVLLGVGKLRVTGGEPLLRRDLPLLVSLLRGLGEHLDLAITTNGTGLDRLAPSLREAGLNRVTVSLDALDATVGSRMAGRPVDPGRTWAALLKARDLGLAIKVNSVIRRDINDDQVLLLASRCREEGIPLRFIEYMDVGNSNGWLREQVVTGDAIRMRISACWRLEPVTEPLASSTARRFRYVDGAGEVGFINSITEPFCRGCDRARVSAEGTLYTCLFAGQGVSLKKWLRTEKVGVAELADRLADVWVHRRDRYSEERAGGDGVG
ncbi:MAG: GTP 3',8-cyclase MoaA, partial [Limisphaerales bacterium]